MNPYHELILQIIAQNSEQKLNLDDLKDIKRDFAKKLKLPDIPTNIKLLRAYHELLSDWKIEKDIEIESLLKKRAVRSQSGIVAVQVLTKPYPCPGQCIFCPNEQWMPKSYISSEPGAMRALLNQFDPIKQVYNRLLSLTMTGHQTDKIEMIVLGGTRDFYPNDYKIDFIKRLYDACNTFSQLEIKFPKDTNPVVNNDEWVNSVILNEVPRSALAEKNINKWILDSSANASEWQNKWVHSNEESRFKYELTNLDSIKYSSTLQEAIKKNETAENRIIGLTVETRPEFATDENCRMWRELWVTRLEMWVQSMYDDILEANRRGHTVQQIREAIHKLRQYWFKFSIHIMPGLYRYTYEKDLWTFQKIYSDPYLKPDEIKFYPTSVVQNTILYDLYQKWEYKPLTIDYIQKLIKQTFLEIIPPYTRIKRLIRDIPATEITAGSNITNLSQLTHNELKKELKSNPEQAKKLYSRLYWKYELVESTPSGFQPSPPIRGEICSLTGELPEGVRGCSPENQDDEIKTTIIWQTPDIDSYRNFVCLDTRSREIRNREEKWKKISESQPNLVIRQYESSVGREFFISFEDLQGYIYWFTRLLLPDLDKTIERDWLGKDTALIRELHIYGQLAWLKENVDSDNQKQHRWFGSQLLAMAESISKENRYKNLSVISWVWVRKYYEKQWYSLVWTYMVKSL